MIAKSMLKEGNVKMLSEEKNIFTMGNIKLGKKNKWTIHYIHLYHFFNDKRIELMVFEHIEATKKQLKTIFKFDSQTEAKQIPSINGECFCLIISSSKETITFSCDSYGELLQWIYIINKSVGLLQNKQKQLPPIPTDDDKKHFKRGSSDPGNIRTKINSVKSENKSMLEDTEDDAVRQRESVLFSVENNSIYGDNRIFAVCIDQNETAKRLKLKGEFNLAIREEGIELLTRGMNIPLYYWRMTTLRRFGSSRSRFSFESGRSSASGEGNFEFFSPSCKLINDAVNDLSIRVKQNMNTNDAMRRESKSPMLQEFSPLSNVLYGKQLSAHATERFQETTNIAEGVTPVNNPILSFESFQERFPAELNVNDKQILGKLETQNEPLERVISPNITSQNLSDKFFNTNNISVDTNYTEFPEKSADRIISSQTSLGDSNTILFDTNTGTKTEERDYENMDILLQNIKENTKDTQNTAYDARYSPSNIKSVPIQFQRMRSESEPNSNVTQKDQIYVNLPSPLLTQPEYKTNPIASFDTRSCSQENLHLTSAIAQKIHKPGYSHSFQNLAVLTHPEFEQPIEYGFQNTNTFPKSLSTVNISEVLQHNPPYQYNPQNLHIREEDRFYQPNVQQSYIHRPLNYRPAGDNLSFPSSQQRSYYNPQIPQHEPTFSPQMMNYYPRSARPPTSGILDNPQRSGPRDGYPQSHPMQQRDFYPTNQ